MKAIMFNVYPGSRTEKLLDSQIGNLLDSKLGGRMFTEQLINDGTLVLLPMFYTLNYPIAALLSIKSKK